MVESVSIKKGAVAISNITIAMGSDNLYQFHRVSILTSLVHTLHQFLEILIIVVRRVDFIDVLLDNW